MQTVVWHYEAFSPELGKGNPAGVVLAADGLSEQAMQQIAQTVGYNECVFVLSAEQADYRLRYWTPGHEVDLCGHATIAACWALAEAAIIDPSKTLQIATNVGVLPINFQTRNQQRWVTMQQAPAQFLPWHGDRVALAAVLGLQPDDLDPQYPICYGSTGIWTLLVPISNLAAMRRMQPQTANFPSVLAAKPRASIHPWCFETYDPQAAMHGRHFSSPYAGTLEDPVTGTASGVMGAYSLHYLQAQARVDLVIEQGQELGRDGRVLVAAQRNGATIEVRINGTAVKGQQLFL